MFSEASRHNFVLPTGHRVAVPKRSLVLIPWAGAPLRFTYGNKAEIDFEGEQLWVEIVVLRMLEREGFDGVWVDTFRRCFRPDMPPAECELPQPAQSAYEAIGGKPWAAPGCWDLLVWRDEQIGFVELKRLKRERIQQGQVRWLSTALEKGFSANRFLVVEWDLLGPLSGPIHASRLADLLPPLMREERPTPPHSVPPPVYEKA